MSRRYVAFWIALLFVGLAPWVYLLLRPPAEPTPQPVGVPLEDVAAREVAEVGDLNAAREASREGLQSVSEMDDHNARSEALAARVLQGGWPLMLLAVLVGCAPKQAPPVFTIAPPAFVEAEAPTYDDAPDACTAALLLPSSPSLLECRGFVVPESRMVACEWAKSEAEAWRGLSEVERRYRLHDRAACEEVAGRRWADVETLRAEARVQRWTALGGIAAALVVGLVVGWSSGQVLP